MLKQSPTFSTIRTPSSDLASHKRYLQGFACTLPGSRSVPNAPGDRIEENRGVRG